MSWWKRCPGHRNISAGRCCWRWRRGRADAGSSPVSQPPILNSGRPSTMLRLGNLIGIALTACVALASPPALADPPAVQVFKSPTCECCAKWVEHLRAHGFAVQVTDVPDVERVKREHGVPERLASCHTALVGRYFVEGHVPAEDVRRLLKEHPRIAGLAGSGMPSRAPRNGRAPFEPLRVPPRGLEGPAT